MTVEEKGEGGRGSKGQALAPARGPCGLPTAAHPHPPPPTHPTQPSHAGSGGSEEHAAGTGAPAAAATFAEWAVHCALRAVGFGLVAAALTAGLVFMMCCGRVAAAPADKVLGVYRLPSPDTMCARPTVAFLAPRLIRLVVWNTAQAQRGVHTAGWAVWYQSAGGAVRSREW